MAKISWVKLKEIANQIDGFEIWGVGLSWQPKELDVTKARKLLIFLEDRRVLYSDPEWEHVRHSIESVLQIREYLVQQILMETDQDSKLYEYAKELRNGCVEFMELVKNLEKTDDGFINYGDKNYRRMRAALGRIRRVFGRTLQMIAIAYQTDVEENLAEILPISPNYDETLLSEEFEQ